MAKRQVTLDDIIFDSGLELNHYTFFKEDPDITIIDIHKTFELFEGFEYYNICKNKKAKYRNMVYTPDFIISIAGRDKLIAVESKGYPRPDYMIRKKLFIMLYQDKYDFIQLNNLKDCENIFKGMTS